MTVFWISIAFFMMALICLGIGYALSFYHHRQEMMDLHHQNTLFTTAPFGFFYTVTGTKNSPSFCSRHLCLQLNILDQNGDWATVLSRLSSESAKAADNAFSTLKKTKNPFVLDVTNDTHTLFFRIIGSWMTHKKQNGFIVWFQDISATTEQSIKSQKALKAERQKNQILNQAWDTLPFPAFIRDSDQNYLFANHAIQQEADALTELHWLSFSFEATRQLYTLTYGQEAKTEEELKIVLNDITQAHKRFCAAAPCAICLINNQAQLVACSPSFADMWKLDPAWLKSTPNYDAYWDYIQENGLLSRVADFADYKKQQRETFSKLSQTTEMFLYLPEGRIIRRQMIPYVRGSVIMLDEDTAAPNEMSVKK